MALYMYFDRLKWNIICNSHAGKIKKKNKICLESTNRECFQIRKSVSNSTITVVLLEEMQSDDEDKRYKP